MCAGGLDAAGMRHGLGDGKIRAGGGVRCSSWCVCQRARRPKSGLAILHQAAAPASKEVFKVAREDILELMRLAEEQEFCQGCSITPLPRTAPAPSGRLRQRGDPTPAFRHLSRGTVASTYSSFLFPRWGVAWPAYMLDDKDHGSSLAVSNQLAQTIGYWGSAGEQRGPQPPARGGSSGPLPWGKKVAPLESEGWQVYPQLPPPPDAEGQEAYDPIPFS